MHGYKITNSIKKYLNSRWQKFDLKKKNLIINIDFLELLLKVIQGSFFRAGHSSPCRPVSLPAVVPGSQAENTDLFRPISTRFSYVLCNVKYLLEKRLNVTEQLLCVTTGNCGSV